MADNEHGPVRLTITVGDRVVFNHDVSRCVVTNNYPYPWQGEDSDARPHASVTLEATLT